MHLACPFCNTVNRVDAERLGQHPVCGTCKSSLLTHEPAVLTTESFDGFVPPPPPVYTNQGGSTIKGLEARPERRNRIIGCGAWRRWRA